MKTAALIVLAIAVLLVFALYGFGIVSHGLHEAATS